MTSTNDGKDVKSNQTSGQRGKSHYIELYKSLDAHLTGDGDLRARTAHLSDAWCRVHSICAHSAPSTHPHLIAWIQRHTSKTILQTQWQSPLSREYHDTLDAAIRGFTNDVEDAIQARESHQCLPWEGQLLERAVWFRSILSNPWDHPVLKVLLNPKEKPPSDDEVLAWLREERGITFTTRLRQLAMSKGCDDLALKLATAIMGRVRACTPVVPDMEQLEEPRATEKQPPATESPSFESILRTECGFTQDVWDLITDIELVLLLKQKDNAQCINLAKATPLRLGHPLVERLASRLELTPREKKIWKGARDVATLVAQVIITRCMVVPWCVGAARTALYWCARSVARLVDAQRLPRVANALAAPAATARHLHTLATAHYAQFKQLSELEDRRGFVCELYIRAITAGMNELEKLKLETTPEKEKEARQTEQTLAAWFIQLGSLLSSSARINCECKLTAFSVHPSPGMYERIKLAPPLPPRAVETQEPVKQETDDPGFGSWATDSRKQTNFVKTSTNLNLQSTQDLANVLSTAIFAEGEGLGLTAELCQDLAVLLSGPRVKTLSWDLDREQLLEYCRTYMERTSGGTRVLTTELRYLNLDPRTYQHLPEEDDGDDDLYYGIEKGYEHLIEFEFEPQPEQIWQDPLWDPEATDSAESDIGDLDYTTTTRRKKKSKYTSDSDNDPLSLEAEAKRTEKKKERPHSKERSKDGNNKNKPKEPNQKEKQKRHKKQDKKRSHKKKNDEDDQTLSKFLGFKVASSFEEEFRNSLSAQSGGVGTSLTNSDNGTQGSLSKDNKAGVSRDGVPVEEVIKALEESSLETGASNKTKEVKNSISKLLQYRKQKSNANTNSSLISLVGSKIVNKEMSESQSMQLNELANEMESLLSDKPAAPQYETKPVSGVVLPNEPNSAVQSKAADISSKNATVKPGQKKTASRKKSVATQVKNAPKQSKNQHSNTPSQPQTYAAGQKSISTQTSDPTQEGGNVLFEVHQNSYQRFLMELQHTKRLALERNSKGSTNASKPADKRTQVTPSTGETSSTLPQSGKPNQQKIDNAPNTFARRNHLHKTNKRVTEHEEALRCSISREIDQRIANLTNSKMQKTQNSNLTTSRMSNSNPKETESPKENSRVEMQRVEKPTPAAMLRAGNPVLSHMLQGNVVKIARNPAYVNQAPNDDSPDQTKIAPPLRSSLSEQDQQDVMSVLWQQNKLNSNASTQGISNANTLNTQKVNDRSRNAVEDIRKIQNKLIFGSPNPQPEGLKTSVIPQNTAIRTAALIQNLQSSKKSKPKVKHCLKKDNVDHSPSSVLAKRYSSPVPATPQHLGLSSEVQHAPNNDKIQLSLVSTPDESKSATNSVITAAPQNIGISPQVKYLSKKHEIRHSLGLLSEKTNNSINTIPATLQNIGTPATVKHCPKKNDFQTSSPTLAPSSNNTVTATPQNFGATSRNWTSIMDGLRKLKTPSRGPTALDIVLQQSHENPSTGNLRQQRIVKTSSRPTSLERPQSQSDRAVDFASESKVVDSKSISTSAARNEPKRQTAVAKTGQKRARKPRNSTPKALQVLQQPVKLLEAKKPIIQYPKRDPIVPGILRSDYDMIEELITDELREEMSEDLDESLPPEQSKSLNEPENHTRAKVLNSPTITSYKGTVHNTSKHLRIVADLTGKPEIVPNVDTKDNLRILSNVAISYINSPAKPEYAPNVACKEKPRILSNVPISHVNLPLKPEYVPNVAKEKLRILSNVPISPTMPLSPKIKNSLAKNVHTNIPIKLTDTVSPVRVSNVVQQQQKPVLKLPNALKSNIVTNTIQYQTIPQNIFVVGPKTVYDPFAAQTDTDSNDFKHNTQIGLDTVTLYRDPQGMTLENPILIDLPQNLQNSTFHVKPAQTNPSGDTIKTPISSYSTNTTTLNPTQKYQNVGKTSNLVTDQTYKPLTQTEPKLHPDDMNKTKLDSDLSLERKMLSELLETKNQDRLKKKRLAIVNRQLDHRCSYTTIPLPYTPMPCKSKTSLLEAGKLTNESSETQCQILESNELLDKRVADFISKEISQLANSANISTNQKATICSNNEEKEVQTPKSVQSTTEVTELLLKSSEAGIASIGKEGIINASLKTSETLAGIKLAETDDSKSTETKTSAKRPVKKSDGSNKKADASNIIPTRVSKRIQSRKQKKAKEKAKRAETQLKRAQEQKEALEILEQSLAISEKTNNLQMEPSLQNVENDLTLSGNKNRPNIISLHDIDFPKFEIGSYTNTETKNGMPQNHSSIGDESNVDHSKKQSDTGRAKLVDKKPTIEKIEVSPTLTKLENEIKTAIEDITMSTVEALVSEKEEVLLDQQKSVSKTAQLMNNQQKTVTMDVAVNKSRKSITATVSGIPAQATEMAILKSQDFADREENVGLAKNNSVLQMQSSPNEIKMNDGITTSKLDVPVNQAPHVGEQMLTQDPLSEKNGVVNEEKNSGLANTLTTSKLTFTTINEEKQFKAPTVTTTNIFEGKNSNVINLESDSDTENHPTVTAANIFEGKNANVINLESDSDTENQEIAGKTQRNACTLVEGVPEKADIPQSYKDSIKITEIPQTNPAPFTKVVRIAMPDNRVLRATVYGNLLVSFDTLFKDPALRDVLLSGLNKRYTVNVQHAAEKDNIVLTKVLNYKVIHNVDTVNLISDDEEEPVQETSTDKKSPQYFLTEFGKHDIGDLDREMHAKHQNKFSQNCSVRLVKCDNKQLTQQNSDCDEENILCTESLSISPKSIVIENIPKQIPEIIELDDSSNDSDCMPIAVDILDQNAPPKLKIDRFINRLMKDYGVDDVPNSQSSQINEECAEPIVLDKDNINDVKTADNDKTSDQKDEYPNINSQCFVKLTRCDDAPNTIFDSYENSTSEKDTNDVVLESPPIPDDEIPDLSPLSPPLTRSGSFSILGEVELDSNTGSPVIDITETISNFLGVDKIHDNKEITSVMEAYDIMVSNRFEVQLAEEQSQPSCCGAEWFNTKLKCQQFALCQNTGHNVENLDISNNVLDEPKDCEDIFDYTSDISNSKSVTTNAPSLKTIMAKYFANLIIPDSLTGVSDHKSEVLTPLNLKRKSTIRLSNSFNKKTLKKVISPLKSKCDKNDDTLHIPEVTNIIDSGCTQLHVSNVAGIKTQDMDMDKNGDVEMLQDVQNDYKNPTETANKPTHPEKKHPDIIENGNIEPRDPGNLIKNDSDKSNESSLKSTINYKLSLKEVFEESTINHKLILIEDVCEHIDTEITDLKNKIKCNNNNATTKAHQSVSVEELAMNTVEKDKEVNMHQDVQKDHKMNHQTENKVGCGLDNPGNHLHILENENTDQQHIDTEIADIENKVNCNTIDATAEFHQSDNVEKIVLNDVEKNKEVQIYHGDRKSNENRYSHHQIENEMGCQTTNPKLKENHLDAIKNENTDEGDSKIVTENLSDQSMKSICKHEVSLESTINEELNQTEVCEHIDIKVADAENKMDSFTHDATTVVLQNDSVGKLASKHEQLGVKVEQSPVNDGIASSSVNLDTERSPKSLSGNVCSEYAIIAENTEKSPVICDDKLIQEIDNDDILDKNETNIEITKKSPSILVEKSIQEVDYDNVLDKNATLIYRDHTGVVLHGIEYEDPVIGTCFVFPLSKSSDSSDFLNDSGESVIEVIKEDDLDVNEVIEYASIVDHGQCSSPKELDNLCYEEIKLNIPKVTYSKKYLKRKICMSDISFSKKRACRSRSRENSDSGAVSRSKRQEAINVSKSTAASNDTTFCKDFKILTNYHSNIKFSYNSPNGLEYFDVNNLLTCWPIKGPVQNIFEGEPDAELFTDMNNEPLDPEINTQTLAEEISADHTKYEKDDHKNETVETDFSMGFGERSGRVISHLKDFGAISKFSAATLPDVKQYQPLLLSKDSYTTSNQNYLQISAKSEQEGIQRFIRGLQLREQVQSFFKNTAKTLSNELMNEKGKNHKIPKKDSEFDFDLYMNGDFKPAPVEMIVQVVQVGQLPVSAGAQNPVCDPRVTHVSDASPSQCSVDNSSPNDTEQGIKTEYTELTTADLSMPVGGQEFAKHPTVPNDSPEPRSRTPSENITIESSMIKTEVRIEIEEESPPSEFDVKSHDEFQSMNNPVFHNTQNHFEENARNSTNQSHSQLPYESSQTQENIEISQQEQPHGSPDKTDQIAHAMTAAGIATDGESTTESRTRALVNLLTQNIYTSRSASDNSTNSYPKTTTSISAMSLQQALAQILPPPLNQTTENNQQGVNSVTSQVLHIVQSKNSSGNITLVDNSQKSVINSPNATPVLHIVQNKAANNCPTSNGGPVQQQNSFTGLSLVDAGLQQGGNQLLHIVNTGNQKNVNTSQLLKRVNLLTNLANVQGSNEQKMLQFVCKSADGKSIQLNAPHQRSMVLRLQPIETPNPQTPSQKSSESSDTSSTSMNTSAASNKDTSASQQEIKSRSVYEENYAKFIQNSSSKPGAENSTSLPKFNQAFGKPVFQDGIEKASEMDSNNVHMASVNSQNENSECQSSENSINLEHMGSMNNPPLLLRKSPAQVSQSQPSIQHIKQTIAPMNIQTMHGGVIYTRQIPVNIGGGQTINLISVPSTELIDESGQKSSDLKFVSQGDIEPSIIKIVPQSQAPPNAEVSQDDGNVNLQNDGQNSQSQPVLTQMRIKLPMLSKNPQMIAGARVVRPSFFQIQRNVIGGANQPVYQQLVLTAAPPLGQQTIRLPQAQARKPENHSPSESQMSSSTLEQLREFDMVLEQVKERSTVQPSPSSGTFSLNAPSTDSTDSPASTGSTPAETTQVLYSIGGSQPMSVAYVNRASVNAGTRSNFTRSPDSSGIADSSSSSTQSQMPHTVTIETAQTSHESTPTSQKPARSHSKSKSRPKSSSHSSHASKINAANTPKPSTQKPIEDEQTTQRILYILAEYKEQVENSPDKDKPAPRRRTNGASIPGSSRRKKRRSGARDLSPLGDDTCRTMGSEDSSCGTSQGDCAESCVDANSPQGSPRKVARKLTFDQDPTPSTTLRPQPPRNVIVADGQTITVARGTAPKPATAVIMPTNYLLPVSMVKGGQQIAIVTNQGPKLLTVSGGESPAANALLLQRLIGPAGLKPVLARTGIRHVRLPTSALHRLQAAFTLGPAAAATVTSTTAQPPDSTASPAPELTPIDLADPRARTASPPWTDGNAEAEKPNRPASPEGSEPWNIHATADPHEYTYEETVRTENLERTVLEAIPDRYSPDMDAHRIFDKMFDVESKKTFIGDSPRCGYDIDSSDCEDTSKAYQVVQKKDLSAARQHRLAHISAAALRHKYAILEHELRLQKSLSEECEDLGVDSPSAAELFPEAELLFSGSPAAHDHGHEHVAQHSHTPQPIILNETLHAEIEHQITEQLLPHDDRNEIDPVNLGLEDGVVTVSEDGLQASITLDHEEFARSHPNTTFHSEPTDEGEPVQPFTIAGLKTRHITSTIYHPHRAATTVLMAAPQATVISQTHSGEPVKYSEINHMIHQLPQHSHLNLNSVLVKDDGLTRFDNILTDSRELHLSHTASAIVHASHGSQVIRRVCYEDDKRDPRFLMDEPESLIAGKDAKMVAEDSRDSLRGEVDDGNSSPERHADLFWESNSASERSESRRPLDFSSDSEKCCKSPYDETNSTDSSGVGTHMRLDSVIKDARGIERSCSAGSSADDGLRLRTYPPKKSHHHHDRSLEPMDRSLSGKTRAGEPRHHSPDNSEVRRRASNRGVVKRGCHCCNGSPAPYKPKKPRPKKPHTDSTP